MTTDEAYARGRAAGLEEAAELLHSKGSVLICGRRRINQMDRHVVSVLERARDDVRALSAKPANEALALAAEIDLLRDALKPFAVAAASLDEGMRPKDHLWESSAAMSLCAADLERARSVLIKTDL